MMNLHHVVLGALLFSGSLTVSLVFGALMIRWGVVDAPDGIRKKQSTPVARLGGVAIAAPLVVGLLGFVIIGANTMFSDTLPLAMLIATLGAFFIGLLDDLRTVPASLKLLMLAGCFGVAAFLGLVPDTLPSPFGAITAPLALIIGSALWMLVFTNAVNFMDGSDGLAVGCTAIMLAGLAMITTYSHSAPIAFGWFVLFGALAGFLIYNLRGNLYAGDAGALGLGALFASLGLVLKIEVWTLATLALPFLIDVLLTLIWRAKHKRSWLKPHRDHAYQRLIDSGWSHMDAAYLYWGLSACCAVAAIISARAGGFLPFAMFWVLTLAGTLLWRSVRRDHTT